MGKIVEFPIFDACLGKNSFYMEIEEEDEKNVLDYQKGKRQAIAPFIAE